MTQNTVNCKVILRGLVMRWLISSMVNGLLERQQIFQGTVVGDLQKMAMLWDHQVSKGVCGHVRGNISV